MSATFGMRDDARDIAKALGRAKVKLDAVLDAIATAEEADAALHEHKQSALDEMRGEEWGSDDELSPSKQEAIEALESMSSADVEDLRSRIEEMRDYIDAEVLKLSEVNEAVRLVARAR